MGTVSHEKAAANDTTNAPERWQLNETRTATAAGSHDDFDAIGARIDARHNDHPGTVTADNQNGRGSNALGLAGFDC
jgi:hypothetical protein